jgi:hypothetical protein
MKKGGTLKMVEANGTDNNNIRSMGGFIPDEVLFPRCLKSKVVFNP